MKKRGDITLWFLVELIAAILVVYMAIDIASAYARGTIFEKLNVAKDLSMQINTLAALPGDAYIINKDLHGYSLKFFVNKIEVFEDSFELSKGIHYLVNIEDSDFDLILDKPEQVVISKIENKITISEEMPDLS